MRAKLTKTFVDSLAAGAKHFEVYDSELLGLIFRVQSTGKRVWFFVYRVHGQRRRLRLGQYPGLSPEGARSLAKQAAGKVAAGTDPQEERREERAKLERDRVSTLRAFLNERYEPWAKATMKTSAEQLRAIRVEFKDWLDKPMAEISPFGAEGWRRERLKSKVQKSTVNRGLQRIGSVLTKAVEWGVLKLHPLGGINKIKPLKVDKSGRVRFLSAEEEASLRKALTDREAARRGDRERFNAWRRARGKKEFPSLTGPFVDHLRPLVLLAMNTGMRRGELLSLRWAQVNLTTKIVTVTGTSSKTAQTRHIPLNREVLELLTQWKGFCEHTEGEDLVFCVKRGRRMRDIKTAWKRVLQMSKVVAFRFHDLRHHFASKLVMAGVPLNTVRELMGHTSLEMTLRYAHLAPDNLAQAVERLSA